MEKQCKYSIRGKILNFHLNDHLQQLHDVESHQDKNQAKTVYFNVGKNIKA